MRCLHGSLLASALSLAATSAAAQQFEEQDGYIAMEMESVSIPSGHEWNEETDLPDTSGSHYQFVGNGVCNGPAGSPLRYTFRVHTGGTYRLHLRAARTYHCVSGAPHGTSNRCEESDRTCTSLAIPDGDTCPASDQCIRTDISNDAFVHVEDGSGGYVTFDDQPSSTEGNPIKLFGGGNESWGWTGTRALDTAGSKWDAEWTLAPGDYTLVVQGRSQLFRIDRLLFLDTARGSLSEGESLAETRFSSERPDAGVAISDAGVAMPGADAAIPTADAGARPHGDGGAAPRTDGGPSAPIDAGPGDRRLSGGCSITQRPAAGASGVGASELGAWGLGALLALVFRRRRSR